MSRVLCLSAVFSVLWLPIASGQQWREQLLKPSPEFSQMPFWFWNDQLSDGEIKRQMADFREHGVYGFVIHPRMGLPKEMTYMGEQWLHFVQTAVEEAARTNMKVCLYDEAMYPSGSAHGEVVKLNAEFAAKGLAVISTDAQGPTRASKPKMPEGAEHVATVLARRSGGKDALDGDSLKLIDVKDDEIDVPGGEWRIMTFVCVPSGGRIRGVFEGEEDNQPNAPMAADLLNPQAMQAFILLAYEPYYRRLGPHFGKCVIGMFTDEPNMLGRRARDGLKPWTTDFASYFEKKRGYSPLTLLPALFFNVGSKTDSFRRDHELTIEQRLEESYYLPLSRWCEQHGIALTGHPAGATEIQPLRDFQIPGQDIVWRGVVPGKALDGPDSTIGKCSSSVARHDSRRRNLNEVFGAFGWQLTMEEMKWLSDWLMVRGVNLLSPHAFYYSMRDYRSQERPPDVGPHNAWWPHYRVFADYTARLCGLLTDSQQVCSVAIVAGNHRLPWRAAKFLFCNQVDFNYLEEWRLVEQARIERGRIVVGPMDYSVIIWDQDEPPTGGIAMKLKEFEAVGGTVRFCTGELTSALLEGITRDIQAEPAAPDLRYCHVVKHGVHFYLLVNEGEEPISTRLAVSCSGRAEWFDAWRAEFTPVEVLASSESSQTVQLTLGRRESIVLCVVASPELEHKRIVADTKPDRKNIEGQWIVYDRIGEGVSIGLGDWTREPKTSAYCGTLQYRTTFKIDKAADARYRIDLGEVRDFATITLNGNELPVRFWGPFCWDVTGVLNSGSNELIVSVTNSLVNQYDPKNRQPSGLIGPVEVVTTPEKQ